MHRLLDRHPQNTNLHLYYGDTFDGMPVMVDKGPFIEQYLYRMKRVIDLTLEQYPRMLAFRADLRLPADIDLPEYAYTNEVITKFFESFKSKIAHNRLNAHRWNQYAHDCKVRYVWAREVVQRPHYHLLILLNRDAFYTVGRLGSEVPNMISRMEEAWASALGVSVEQVNGLVHRSSEGVYRVDRDARTGKADELPELFRRASYLCKAATKSYGDRQRGFDTSKN